MRLCWGFPPSAPRAIPGKSFRLFLFPRGSLLALLANIWKVLFHMFCSGF